MAERTPSEAAPARRALVTGVSCGIGAAIAEWMLDDGWEVVGLSRGALTLLHSRLRFVSVDLMDADALTGFLLSDAAASVTGRRIVVCGGASLV